MFLISVYHAINFSDNGASNVPVLQCKSFQINEENKNALQKTRAQGAATTPTSQSEPHAANILLAAYICKII